jgi:hypothetical protein
MVSQPVEAKGTKIVFQGFRPDSGLRTSWEQPVKENLRSSSIQVSTGALKRERKPDVIPELIGIQR